MAFEVQPVAGKHRGMDLQGEVSGAPHRQARATAANRVGLA